MHQCMQKSQETKHKKKKTTSTLLMTRRSHHHLITEKSSGPLCKYHTGSLMKAQEVVTPRIRERGEKKDVSEGGRKINKP